MSGWDFTAKVCGNCRFWPLSVYSQSNWDDRDEAAGRHVTRPSGIGGYHTDGSVSDCRRHAPREVDAAGDVIKRAIWPQTRTCDGCGDFELRPRGVKP